METTPLCPRCGQPLPSNAPKGLCPECLMKGAFPTGAGAAAPEKPPRFIPPQPSELARQFPQLEFWNSSARVAWARFIKSARGNWTGLSP